MARRPQPIRAPRPDDPRHLGLRAAGGGDAPGARDVERVRADAAHPRRRAALADRAPALRGQRHLPGTFRAAGQPVARHHARQLPQSARSARPGLMRVARRAGPLPASNAARTSTPTAETITYGSFGLTSNRNDCTRRDASSAIGTLIASPTAASAQTSRSTIHITVPWRAPSAMRMPISGVRRVTPYAIVP